MAGSVRRHPEGGWIADVTVRGCRRTRRAATKAQATQAKADLVRELEERPSQAKPASKAFTLADARRLSLQVRWAGLAWERTAAIYSQQACDFLGADLPVTEVTAAQVEAWRQSYLSAGSRPATVNKRVSCLRAMLSDAALHGHLAAVPALPRQLKSRNGRERILEDDERDRILRALLAMEQPLVADLVEFMLETGCRVSEALKITGQDVSPTAATVSFWVTKNGRSRTVPLTGRCLDALRPHLPAVPNRRVFPIKYDTLAKAWAKAKDTAGVDDDALVLHSLRHTCATRLARGGVSLHQLQAWGGWSSPAACQRYLHHSVESLGVCVSVLEGK